MKIHRTRTTLETFGWVILLLVAISGCNQSDKVAMSGAISFKGQPVESGSLVLTPLDPSIGPSTGSAIEQGKYYISALKGPRRAMKYRVEISSFDGSDKAPPPAANESGGDDLLAGLKGPKGEQRVFVDRIPPSYNRESKLEITIPDNAGQFDYDFQLK